MADSDPSPTNPKPVRFSLTARFFLRAAIVGCLLIGIWSLVFGLLSLCGASALRGVFPTYANLDPESGLRALSVCARCIGVILTTALFVFLITCRMLSLGWIAVWALVGSLVCVQPVGCLVFIPRTDQVFKRASAQPIHPAIHTEYDTSYILSFQGDVFFVSKAVARELWPGPEVITSPGLRPPVSYEHEQ